jgi:hypothetical protein
MRKFTPSSAPVSGRRDFLKRGAAAGATAVGFTLLATQSRAVADEAHEDARLPAGDVAILRFLAAAELIESDLWQQYAELGGAQLTPSGTPDMELPGLTGGSAPYIAALQVLDMDMPQYIHDNTEDEISHATFLNQYLVSKGASPVDLDPFRQLPSSRATGARQINRLTNLTELTVDTSWWTRYRSRTENPDLDPSFQFPQAVPSLSAGKFPAIPRSDDDLGPQNHIQAIANTAGFHFCFIEQGGSSLYPALAQKVTSAEVLKILLSIGPVETSHFQTWHDKAGNAPAITDPNNPALVFPNLNAAPFGGEDFQANLIMPEPCPFLSSSLPVCSVIRPTPVENAATGAVQSLIADGLFLGQSREFLELVMHLAREADAARRELRG